MIKVLNKSILLITIFFFSIILIASFIFDSNVYYTQNKLISFLVSIFTLALWFLIYKIINKYVKDKVSIKIHLIILIIYFLLVSLIQFFVVKYLLVAPGWDYNVVFENAKYYFLNGNRNNAIYNEYFEYFPNNILLFYIMLIAMKLGSIIKISPFRSEIILNIIFIDLALLIFYLTLIKKFNFKIGLFGLILTFFFFPLFLYTPIFYSDTLSLFIPISILYLYLFIDKTKVICKKNTFIFLIMGLLLFLGKEIKITSIFILIAITIHYVIETKNLKSIINLVILMITFVFCSLLFQNIIVKNPKYQFEKTGYGSYPYTHWIMMGIEDIDADNSGRNAYGGYNENDYNLSRSYKTGKDAISFNIKEYLHRVNKMGLVGYPVYLIKKAVNTWSDGFYYSDVALSINHIEKANDSVYNYLFVEQSKYLLIYLSQGIQFSFLILLIIGAIKKLKNSKDFDYIRLTILALFLFFLFWENRSRYLYNYIPIFIFIICEYYYLKNKSFSKKYSLMEKEFTYEK